MAIIGTLTFVRRTRNGLQYECDCQNDYTLLTFPSAASARNYAELYELKYIGEQDAALSKATQS